MMGKKWLWTLVFVVLWAIPAGAQDESGDGYQDALSRIRRAEITGATVLDLSSLSLTALPPEIGELTHLQRLDLSNNDLETLPPEIGQLTNLQQLSLAETHVKTLPTEFGNLYQLQELDSPDVTFPPSAVRKQGLATMLSYLREYP